MKVIGVHLLSNNHDTDNKRFDTDSITGVKKLFQYLSNISNMSIRRGYDAKAIVSNLFDGPTIVMGDFNDVCGSKTLNILENVGFKDAWWEGGLGYGATIHYPFPYRIDHILYSGKLQLTEIMKIDANGLSDHDALVATFKWK